MRRLRLLLQQILSRKLLERIRDRAARYKEPNNPTIGLLLKNHVLYCPKVRPSRKQVVDHADGDWKILQIALVEAVIGAEFFRL